MSSKSNAPPSAALPRPLPPAPGSLPRITCGPDAPPRAVVPGRVRRVLRAQQNQEEAAPSGAASGPASAGKESLSASRAPTPAPPAPHAEAGNSSVPTATSPAATSPVADMAAPPALTHAADEAEAEPEAKRPKLAENGGA